jgi:hypothetical protein
MQSVWLKGTGRCRSPRKVSQHLWSIICEAWQRPLRGRDSLGSIIGIAELRSRSDVLLVRQRHEIAAPKPVRQKNRTHMLKSAAPVTWETKVMSSSGSVP